MGAILLKVGLIGLLVGLLALMAWGDYRTRKAREAEQKAARLTGPDRKDSSAG